MRWGFLVAVLTALFCPSSICSAQSAEGDSTAFAQTIAQGIAEFEHRNFAEAKVHFSRAYALSPTARTARALGMVEFELRNYPTAIRYLEEALSDQLRSLTGTLREETQSLLERANAYVARLRLDLSPANAVAWVDGAPAKETTLILPLGQHVLEFRAEKCTSQKRTLFVAGGEARTLAIWLLPAKTSAQTSRDDRTPRIYKNPWFWSAVGLVAIGAAAGVSIALTRDNTRVVQEPVYHGSSEVNPLVAP